jgi:hypothetical protein
VRAHVVRRRSTKPDKRRLHVAVRWIGLLIYRALALFHIHTNM